MDIKELLGVTLGTCTIERVIGRGGMGAVYQAQQARPVRSVAVKVLVPSADYEHDPEQQRIFLERFRREANTVATLEHKNILPIYEYAEGFANGQELAYLVMPYIRGGTLRERIDEMRRNRKQFDLETIASYIDQIADALSYAHSQGVIHRDIKPSNLLFHQDGRLLLSDFGIARLKVSTSQTLTSAGSFIGTADYASPEQIGAGDVDSRSDIYSLGIILYELLTGSVPFSGANPFAVMTKHLSDPVPSVRNARPDLPAAVEAVVMKALEKNPANRYQTATALAADLRTAIVPPAPPPQQNLRLSGDGRNTDPTVADHPWQVIPPLPAPQPTPGGPAVSGAPNDVYHPPIEPTSPAMLFRPPGGAVTRPWQWPSQLAKEQGQVQVPRSPNPVIPKLTADLAEKKYRQGRRLFYYGALLLALLLQFLIFFLLIAEQNKAGGEYYAILGVLVGTSVNLLALAAIGFSGVTRNRDIRKYFNLCLAVTIVAPAVSGFFINFGTAQPGPPGSAIDVYFAYAILLISNIIAMRQVGLVDRHHEQVEAAPVLWRSVLVGALTGLLPLTIILLFALTAPLPKVNISSPLLSLFATLFVALVGAPTPGAVMAVWFSQKMSFPVLVRTSAMAGLLMFLGAFILVVLLGLVLNSNQPWPGLLVLSGILGLIGALRGMLDAWIYQRIRRKEKGS